jgi:para-nitrobenzyl esterase
VGPFRDVFIARFPLLGFRLKALSRLISPLSLCQKVPCMTPSHGTTLPSSSDDIDTFSDPTKPNGAYHVVEIIFEFPLGIFKVSLDANQQVLARQVIAQWTTFARTGNPTAAGTPSWPRFTEGSQRMMSLQPAGDNQVTTASQISLDHHCDFWTRLVPADSA